LRQEVLVCDENIFCTKRGLSSSRAESLLCVVLESEIRDPENKLDVILLVMRKTGLVRIGRLGANKSGFPQEEEVYLAHSYCKSEV